MHSNESPCTEANNYLLAIFDRRSETISLLHANHNLLMITRQLLDKTHNSGNNS